MCKRDKLSQLYHITCFSVQNYQKALAMCFSLNALVEGRVGQMMTIADEGGEGGQAIADD